MFSTDAAPLVVCILNNLQREPQNEKFKKINLEGKAGTKLKGCPAALATLGSVGFEERSIEGVNHYVVVEIDAARLALALATVSQQQPAAKKARPAPEVVDESKLSTKQQQRLAVEKREKAHKDDAKRRREETKAQIARDNHARKHDENWTTTSGVNKGGKDIDTFRGKFGEDKGG